jgi:hypothetical protein
VTDRPTGGEPEHLDPEEAWRLVRSTGIGRVAMATPAGPPLVVPVNYRVDDRTFLVRIATGTVAELLQPRSVSFEVDEIDPAHRSGWSVLAQVTPVVEDPDCDDDDEPRPWAAGDRHRLVRLVPTFISGRRITAADRDWDERGYL